ncbi:MAG: hypothetical protein MPW14_25480 (plasmid) [Candidatus Manganitrophus sp.]|nr:hypothetical protein [Candidatus Manganitrophus sp.]MDC4228375.1 hypothetical protein [Candidatus Manganitrophus sp.]WDT73670.1 MAG: hypothetical protein MPW17_22280 [Candidatus Manganitrophus sp.]WDT77826.1 MAG: hypothetical protein MPW16_21610 [Candidatus Manganitrophus sp.]WDT82743.1 MAG: hypothetical protein MPW14_25480 [Candidatus Manganitrophus sp.]
MVILKTDLPADTLPLENEKVDETSAGRVMGEIEPFEPTTQKNLTLDLEPGSYVLLCNIVETENGESEGHYRMGMRTVFEVIEQAPR